MPANTEPAPFTDLIIPRIPSRRIKSIAIGFELSATISAELNITPLPAMALAMAFGVIPVPVISSKI